MKSVRILAATLLVLGAASLTQASAAGGPRNQIKTFMLSSGVDPDARGKIIEVTNKAQTHFMIQVSNLSPDTSYDVVVNGAVMEAIVTDADGSGRVFHQSKKHGSSLPYDPAGATIEIQATGTTMLSASVPATPQAAQARIDIHLDLTASLGVAGSAEANFRSRFGRMLFDVEIRGGVPGSYDLVVGGQTVGTIVVDASGRGDLHFDSFPDDPSNPAGVDLLLTFDPRGQTIEVMQSAVATFSGTFPALP